ncbi:MAG: malonate transporter subunit MadL [Cytophagales bacterium]|nr:malonate transporter subunit MadL [Cytophagales bacterium]
MIYGVVILAVCFLAGRMLGESLGILLGIDANIGGVGFAMVLLVLAVQGLEKKKWFTMEMEGGVIFWSNLYIPVIVAMSAIQNVKGAFSSGLVAVLAGIIPSAVCLLILPWLSRLGRKQSNPDESR